MLKKTASGIAAGIMVSIGGAVFLSCENRIAGAVLFSVALLSICMAGYSLYTGKIGFIPEKHDQEAFSVLLLGLMGNTIGTILCGLALRSAIASYRDNKTPLGILFCIPVFILSGFEHSIADIFYFAASGIVSLKAFGFILTVILGNSIGGMLLPVLTGTLEKH